MRPEKLDFWIKHGRNVLFVGKHGVGKTSMVKAAFDRANLKWRYFSASTMDPWVDFIGVPRAVEQDGQQVLELVRPQEFADDEVEALFFDEFNRSHSKVRNGVMELLQFKSINGRKFNNLKIVWAAINPDDEDDYDVEKLDPAQEDRFHIRVDLPYACDQAWFSKEFGSSISKAAIEWWKSLKNEIKAAVSPRRLEYALREHEIGGDMRDILPQKSNVSKLIAALQHGPIQTLLDKMQNGNQVAEARKFLAQENNYAAAVPFIGKTKDRMEFFIPLMPKEKIASLMVQKKVSDFLVSKLGDSTSSIGEIVAEVYHASQDRKVHSRIEKACRNVVRDDLPKTLQHLSTKTVGGNIRHSVTKNHASGITTRHGTRKSGQAWLNFLASLKKKNANTQDRFRILGHINEYLPATMTPAEARDTLALLDNLAARSHANTFKRMTKELIPLANHCCHQLENAGEKNFSHLASNICDKIRKSQSNRKFFFT